MALLYCDDKSIIVDHSKYINRLYKNVQSCTKEPPKGYKLLPLLFSIVSNKITSTNRKRKREIIDINTEALHVKQMYKELLEVVPEDVKNMLMSHKTADTALVRDTAQRIIKSTSFEHKNMKGGNSSNEAVECLIENEKYIVPARSRFISGCVKERCKELIGQKFDLIVADPPWWNKYIRRLKAADDKLSYAMLYNEDVAALPVKQLLSDKCLVAVWCTNAESNISAVKDLIFPSWGVEYLTTWYWLKVDVNMEPLGGFREGCQKQPYERIIFGKCGDVTVPECKLIVSVPSALHSHKPPLLDVLTPSLIKEPQVLELFARYLLPNTTSVGFEPLRWQHSSLYESVT